MLGAGRCRLEAGFRPLLAFLSGLVSMLGSFTTSEDENEEEVLRSVTPLEIRERMGCGHGVNWIDRSVTEVAHPRGMIG